MVLGRELRVWLLSHGTRGGLFSDYSNSPCNGNSHDCTSTIAEAVALVNSGGVTTSAFGVDVSIPINATNATACDKYYPDSLNATTSHGANCIPEALAAVEQSDVVVLVLGIDGTIEHEN